MADVLGDLSEWAACLHYADLPEPVVERARWALADTIAVMCGGRDTPAARIAHGVASHAQGPSALIGGGTTTADHAAFANAVAASALDFDDGHYLAGGIHPGSIVVPAVLAMTSRDSTIEDVVTAVVVGYEVGLRAASQLWPRHEQDLYHCTGAAGTIAAAAAGARLRGLDAETFARAVKIAWAHAPMSTFALPMVKESIGWGAKTGVAAVTLAVDGFMATPTGYRVPDNEVLPSSLFARAGAEDDPFVLGHGKTWHLLDTYVKPYAACRYTHAAAHGLVSLMNEHQLAAADIDEIAVHTHRGATFLDETAPGTIETAQYSFPFVLASVALHGRAGRDELGDQHTLDEPRRLALARKIGVEYDPAMDEHYPRRYASRVEVTSRGHTHRLTCVDAPGDPELPLTRDDLVAKWSGLLDDAGVAEAGSVIATLLEGRGALDGFLTNLSRR